MPSTQGASSRALSGFRFAGTSMLLRCSSKSCFSLMTPFPTKSRACASTPSTVQCRSPRPSSKVPPPPSDSQPQATASFRFPSYTLCSITGIPVVHPDSEANDDSGGGLGEDATNRQDFDPFAAMGDFPSIPSSVGPANAPYGMHPSPSSFPAAPDGRQPPSPMDAMDFSGSAWGNSFGPLSSSPGEGPSARSTSLPPGYDFPPSSGQPGMPASSPSGGGVSLDSVEQMLALFPTVPMTSSSASVSPPTGGSWSNWPNPPSASSGHSASPTSFSSGQAQPRSGPAPLIPKATQGPQPTPQSPPAPASAPATSSSNKGPTGDFTPSAENIAKAQKVRCFFGLARLPRCLRYSVRTVCSLCSQRPSVRGPSVCSG